MSTVFAKDTTRFDRNHLHPLTVMLYSTIDWSRMLGIYRLMCTPSCRIPASNIICNSHMSESLVLHMVTVLVKN